MHLLLYLDITFTSIKQSDPFGENIDQYREYMVAEYIPEQLVLGR